MNNNQSFLFAFAWTVPFICFVIGYVIMSIAYAPKSKPVPALVGKHISHAAQLLAHEHLNLRIIECKVDDQLPDGTIMSQSPSATTTIKPNQSVYCVLSAQPPKPKAPALVGVAKAQLITQLQSMGVKTQLHYVQSTYPTDTCIAQYPAAGQPFDSMNIVIYLAHNNKPIIVPDCTQSTIEQLQSFLEPHQIPLQVIGYPDIHTIPYDALVAEQRPIAGTILSPNTLKTLTFQVSAS